MTEIVLGLVPQYGLYLLGTVVFLACLAVPLPASMLVLVSGSFAATDDLVLWQVFLITLAAFMAGDQLAYHLARRLGPTLTAPLRARPKFAPIMTKSEDLLARRGGVAVLLSHTVLSPTCPYVTFLSGAGGLSWRSFSLAALFGAFLWTSAYVGLGFVFATQLAQVADILNDFLGIVLAGAVACGCIWWLKRKWTASNAL